MVRSLSTKRYWDFVHLAARHGTARPTHPASIGPLGPGEAVVARALFTMVGGGTLYIGGHNPQRAPIVAEGGARLVHTTANPGRRPAAVSFSHSRFALVPATSPRNSPGDRHGERVSQATYSPAA